MANCVIVGETYEGRLGNRERYYAKYVYVAGPIKIGDQFVNTRQGILASDFLLRLGYVPFCPFSNGMWQLVAPHSYEEWLAFDFAWLEKCDAVLRIPGESSGADREVAHARTLGIPVFFDILDLDDYARNGPRKVAEDDNAIYSGNIRELSAND